MKITNTLHVIIQPECRSVRVKGREAWALAALIKAGPKGCTPIDTPGPRWSGYIFDLKKRGFNIETVNEKHGGPFPGTHARYCLRSSVVVVEDQTLAA